MYFPYEETFRILSFFLPKDFQQKFLDYGMRLKLQRNLNYIDKNKVSVLNRLKEKLKNNKKINVIFYIYDETTMSIVGKDTGKTFTMGQRVMVKAVHVDKLLRTIDFELVESELVDVDYDENELINRYTNR